MRMASLSVNVAGSYVGYLIQRAFLDSAARSSKLRSANKRAAERMRGELQSLRGPAMKLGQALSIQGGVLPDEIMTELSKLQMEAHGLEVHQQELEHREAGERETHPAQERRAAHPADRDELPPLPRASITRGS